jgi:hypothetical protein
MKLRLALLLCAIACLSEVFAQPVSVAIVFDEEHYLPHEPLVAKVRITNRSGRTVELGKTDDWLTFNIEGRNNFVVARQGRPPVAGEFSLDSGTIGTKGVNLAPYFELARPGRFSLTATVRIPEWNVVVTSEPALFDIVTGSKLWEQEFGMPNPSAKPDELPEMRRYALIQTIHTKHLKLYVRISDASEGTVYRIFQVGPMVSFSNPEPQLDRFNNLHILYQTGARSFNYSVVNPDGVLLSRETHDHSGTRPILRPTSEGRITVVGGKRRPAASDLPPPSLTSSRNAATPEP